MFAACWEGTVTVLDTAHDGKRLSTIARGSGFDVIGYAPLLGHLYLAGSSTHPGQWVSFCAISGILAADRIREDLG